MHLDLRQEPNSAGRLPQHPDLRRSIEPLPVIDALPENGAKDFQDTIHRRVANAFGKLRLRDAIDDAAANDIERFAAKVWI